MGYLILKALVSGVIIAIVSEVARRQAGLGALIASLPLISVMGMIWLWQDRPEATHMVEHMRATFWYVLPSLPMFLLMPLLMMRGWPFWGVLALGCAVTVALYLGMVTLLARWGITL